MEKRYLILVNGVKAKTRATLAFALKDKKELEARGMRNVSIAYNIENKSANSAEEKS